MTDEETPEKKHADTANNVAVILAVGISASLFLVTAALLAAAWMRFSSGVGEGLSENGTQLLTGWGGGIIGVLGSYIGFTFGKKVNGEPFLPGAPPPKTPEPPPEPEPLGP